MLNRELLALCTIPTVVYDTVGYIYAEAQGFDIDIQSLDLMAKSRIPVCAAVIQTARGIKISPASPCREPEIEGWKAYERHYSCRRKRPQAVSNTKAVRSSPAGLR